MVKLTDLYFQHDPRPHEEQCEVTGVTWPDGCSLRDGGAMPVNQPCKVECLWSPLCRVLLRSAASSRTGTLRERLPIERL
jgi:hypothetical protein